MKLRVHHGPRQSQVTIRARSAVSSSWRHRNRNCRQTGGENLRRDLRSDGTHSRYVNRAIDEEPVQRGPEKITGNRGTPATRPVADDRKRSEIRREFPHPVDIDGEGRYSPASRFFPSSDTVPRSFPPRLPLAVSISLSPGKPFIRARVPTRVADKPDRGYPDGYCRIYIYLMIYICIMIYIYIPYVNEFSTFG